jgi:hypothetical protein
MVPNIELPNTMNVCICAPAQRSSGSTSVSLFVLTSMIFSLGHDLIELS